MWDVSVFYSRSGQQPFYPALLVSLWVSRSACVNILCEGFSIVESHIGTIMEILWPYSLLTRKDLASLTSVCCLLARDTSSCRQVGCFSLQIPLVCSLLQSLFLWPVCRNPKQSFFFSFVYRQSINSKIFTPGQRMAFYLTTITLSKPCVNSCRIMLMGWSWCEYIHFTVKVLVLSGRLRISVLECI